jgi:hypothetical protein
MVQLQLEMVNIGFHGVLLYVMNSINSKLKIVYSMVNKSATISSLIFSQELQEDQYDCETFFA